MMQSPTHPHLPKRALLSALAFFKTEAGGGTLLGLFALLGLILSNSLWAKDYLHLQHLPLAIEIGSFHLALSLDHWIKEGLMSVFFFVVGLEIKAELQEGGLSTPQSRTLPIACALGGMVVPALVYLLLAKLFHVTPAGWSVPMATDIAFALGALALIDKGLPKSLRLFLLALAIIDDLGAVLVIGVAYSQPLNWMSLLQLAFAFVVWSGLSLLHLPRRLIPLVYGLGFLILLMLALKSGLAPSLVAVAAAQEVPLRPVHKGEPQGRLHRFMHGLHPFVVYGILPLFAFFAAGIPFSGLGPNQSPDMPLALAIALGLLLGKPIGIVLASYAMVRLRLAELPEGANFGHMLGMGFLCGIGFTMSLFLGALALSGSGVHEDIAMKLGIIGGSILSAILGMLVLSTLRSQPEAS